MAAGKYSNVYTHQHNNNYCACNAYACTNSKEFFAELSVAFLWDRDETTEYNRTYPFNRAQLKLHDPATYHVLKREWQKIVFEEAY